MATKIEKEQLCTARVGWIATLGMGLIKMVVSGVVIEGVISFGEFDFAGFALVLGAVGGIYWGRQDSKRKERQFNVQCD